MATYVTIGDAEVAAESPVTVSLLTRLRDNALAYAGAPSGTRAMWQQTSAPLGWTKESLYHDYTPRVVTGSVGTGGSVNFSTLFGRTATDSVTLSHGNLPNPTLSVSVNSHTHGLGFGGGSLAYDGAPTSPTTQGPTNVPSSTGAVAPGGTAPLGGSGTSFSPAIDMRCKYIDNIIAQKD